MSSIFTNMLDHNADFNAEMGIGLLKFLRLSMSCWHAFSL